MEKKFYRALIFALALDAAIAIALIANNFPQYREQSSYSQARGEMYEFCTQKTLNKFREYCSQQPAPYQFCLMGEGAILEATVRHCKDPLDSAQEARSRTLELQAALILIVKISTSIALILIALFYGIRWVLTNKIRPLIPK